MFQYLLSSQKINIDYLTTHEFGFEDAPKAFDLVVNKTEPFIGIALKYDASKTHGKHKIVTHETTTSGDVNISFIGAGSYAQGNLLPNIPENNAIARVGVLTNSGTSSKRVAEKFKFGFCASNEADVLDDKTNTLFIATRHDSHGSYVLKGLKANKNIFVEKPLCLLESELKSLLKAIKIILNGENYFSPRIKTILMEAMFTAKTKSQVSLTKREKEVLKLIAKEFTTKEIASQLFLSKHTIESYRKNLISKLNVRNLAGLTRYAMEEGLLN